MSAKVAVSRGSCHMDPIGLAGLLKRLNVHRDFDVSRRVSNPRPLAFQWPPRVRIVAGRQARLLTPQLDLGRMSAIAPLASGVTTSSNVAEVPKGDQRHCSKTKLVHYL